MLPGIGGVLLAELGRPRAFDKFLPGSANSSVGGGGMLLACVATGLCAIFIFAFVIDGVLARRRMEALMAEPPPDGRMVKIKCQYCKTTFVASQLDARFNVVCPACKQTNPAPKRISLIRRFLRWVFYPSFQDLF